MKYKCFFKGNIVFYTQSRKNIKELVAAFPCSWAPKPWSQDRGWDPPRFRKPGRGTVATRK